MMTEYRRAFDKFLCLTVLTIYFLFQTRFHVCDSLLNDFAIDLKCVNVSVKHTIYRHYETLCIQIINQ